MGSFGIFGLQGAWSVRRGRESVERSRFGFREDNGTKPILRNSFGWNCLAGAPSAAPPELSAFALQPWAVALMKPVRALITAGWIGVKVQEHFDERDGTNPIFNKRFVLNG